MAGGNKKDSNTNFLTETESCKNAAGMSPVKMVICVESLPGSPDTIM